MAASSASDSTRYTRLVSRSPCAGRAEVEHQFHTANQKLGLGDYERRRYVGLIRHHILCMLVMLFAAEQRAQQVDFFPELTVEQVTELVDAIVADWLAHRRRRKHGRETFREFTVRRQACYQAPNRAAKRARGVFAQRE